MTENENAYRDYNILYTCQTSFHFSGLILLNEENLKALSQYGQKILVEKSFFIVIVILHKNIL